MSKAAPTLWFDFEAGSVKHASLEEKGIGIQKTSETKFVIINEFFAYQWILCLPTNFALINV